MTTSTYTPTLITAVVPPKHAAERAWPELTAHDTCDTCGYRAYVRVAKDDLELVFCSHHYSILQVILMLQGFALVTDQRAELTQKPGASA
jgi:hypothetical protein